MSGSPKHAAFFDLDRTLLSGSSTPVFQRHLAEHGLGSELGSLGRGYFKFYELAGESGLPMRLAKYGARVSRGWSVETVRQATRAAAEELAESVLPYAMVTMQRHRDEGAAVVMATTSPEEWVRPLADRLGFDDVIATRWVEAGETFTGELAGPFVWGKTKRDAVREWAHTHGIDLTGSFAYSDSYFDAPMLALVGHGVAVNPDARLAAVAALRGWPIRSFDAPPGVIKLAGVELQDLFRPFARPGLVPNADVEVNGIGHIPAKGPAIVVANHRSYFDSAMLVLVLAMAGRNPRFLGKKEVFDAPIIGTLAHAVGGIRVDRSTGSDEPLERAAAALDAGEVVTLLPQGTIPRGPAFFDPELKARWGAAKLAAMTKAPVIPLGLWGTEKVWPRSSRLPHLELRDPPKVTATVGPPVDLKYRSPDADTKRMMTAISNLLPPEAREPYEPTEEELLATFPSGYNGDPSGEVDRRPGEDT